MFYLQHVDKINKKIRINGRFKPTLILNKTIILYLFIDDECFFCSFLCSSLWQKQEMQVILNLLKSQQISKHSHNSRYRNFAIAAQRTKTYSFLLKTPRTGITVKIFTICFFFFYRKSSFFKFLKIFQYVVLNENKCERNSVWFELPKLGDRLRCLLFTTNVCKGTKGKNNVLNKTNITIFITIELFLSPFYLIFQSYWIAPILWNRKLIIITINNA